MFEEARLVKHGLIVIKDDFFLVAMGSLILLMQAGFAFLEAGSIRAKNATNILIKNFTDLCAGRFPLPSLHYYLPFNNIPISDLTSLSIQCPIQRRHRGGLENKLLKLR